MIVNIGHNKSIFCPETIKCESESWSAF